MGIIEAFVEAFFQEVLWASIKRIGALVRWGFLRKKYTYNEVYSQEWNGRVGLLTIAFFVILGYFILNA